MNISVRPNAPLLTPSPPAGTRGADAPAALGHAEKTESGSKAEPGFGDKNLPMEYPAASKQEMLTREKRAAKKFKFPSFKFTSKSPTPKPPMAKPPTAKPPTAKPSSLPKPKLTGGPNGAQGAINSAKTIDALHQKKLFPPISSQLATSARNALTGAGVSTLVNLPFSVAEHIGSKAIADRIDAQSKMPGAAKQGAEGTVSFVDPSATDQQKIDARLEDSEIKTEVLVNSIFSINEGPDAKAAGKDPDAPTDTAGRLTALEQRMDAIEIQMRDIAQRYGLVYTPYVAPESASAATDASRMNVIEQRYSHMNKMLKKLISAKAIDAGDE
jgi:hypothetical protein